MKIGDLVMLTSNRAEPPRVGVIYRREMRYAYYHLRYDGADYAERQTWLWVHWAGGNRRPYTAQEVKPYEGYAGKNNTLIK